MYLRSKFKNLINCMFKQKYTITIERDNKHMFVIDEYEFIEKLVYRNNYYNLNMLCPYIISGTNNFSIDCAIYCILCNDKIWNIVDKPFLTRDTILKINEDKSITITTIDKKLYAKLKLLF